jgi:hypothetical protein
VEEVHHPNVARPRTGLVLRLVVECEKPEPRGIFVRLSRTVVTTALFIPAGEPAVTCGVAYLNRCGGMCLGKARTESELSS